MRKGRVAIALSASLASSIRNKALRMQHFGRNKEDFGKPTQNQHETCFLLLTPCFILRYSTIFTSHMSAWCKETLPTLPTLLSVMSVIPPFLHLHIIYMMPC
jgi:hypothetical protein